MKKRSSPKKEKGSLLISAFIIMLVLSLVGWAFVTVIVTLNSQSQQTGVSKQAYYAADAGIERAKMNMWARFKDYGLTANKMQSFKSYIQSVIDSGGIMFDEAQYIGDSTYIVYLSIADDDNSQVTVRVRSVGRAYATGDKSKYIDRTIIADIKYYLSSTPLLDFAYFCNNFAWHTGDIRNGGSIGSNGFLRLNNSSGLPNVAGGDRYTDYVDGNLVNKIDDGGAYGAKGIIKSDGKRLIVNPSDPNYSASAVAAYCEGYNDIYPNLPDKHDGSTFSGIGMPSLAGSSYYSSRVIDMETEALGKGDRYGIYTYVGNGTKLYNSSGIEIGQVSGDGYIKISDAVYGDDINGGETNTGYYLNNGKWTKGEGKNIVLTGGTTTNPLKVYGAVVVEDNVALGDNVIDGDGSIIAGGNIYVAGAITYKDQPTLTTSGALAGYRGFTSTNNNCDGDSNAGSSCPTSLTDAETNQEEWLSNNLDGTKDLLGLFANESICVGNMYNSDERGYLSSALSQGTTNLVIYTDVNKQSTTTETSHGLNESDEARLGPDGVPNTRSDKYKYANGTYRDIEYAWEKDGKWNVSFYTANNLPASGAKNPYSNNECTYLAANIDPNTIISKPYSNWTQAEKDAVIPGSGEDLDGDGYYDNGIDVYDAVAFSENDANSVRSNSKTWSQALTFDPNTWRGTMYTSGKNLGDVKGSNGVTRLDAITYTNHVWGGFIKGPSNGTLIARIESTRVNGTTTCPVNHDDRVTAGGKSLSNSNILLPQIEYMEVISWRE